MGRHKLRQRLLSYMKPGLILGHPPLAIGLGFATVAHDVCMRCHVVRHEIIHPGLESLAFGHGVAQIAFQRFHRVDIIVYASVT